MPPFRASNSKMLGHSEMRAEHPNMLAIQPLSSCPPARGARGRAVSHSESVVQKMLGFRCCREPGVRCS